MSLLAILATAAVAATPALDLAPRLSETDFRALLDKYPGAEQASLAQKQRDFCGVSEASIRAGSELRSDLVGGYILLIDPDDRQRVAGQWRYQLTDEERRIMEQEAIRYEADAQIYRMRCARRY